MTVYVAEMIDEMRMYLQEDPDAQDPDLKITLPRKIALLNRGIRAMFPAIYQPSSEDGSTIDEDTLEYELDELPGIGIISYVEVLSSGEPAYRLLVEDYEVLPGPLLKIKVTPEVATQFDGWLLRVVCAVPISPIIGPDYDDLETEVWLGPEESLGIPVYYAMSMASAVYLDDRLQYDQGSVAMQQGAATPSDIMTASTFWMDRFNYECQKLSMPAPLSRY